MIVIETETLTRGRIFGPTLERRLRTSIETLLKVAEWNTRVAAALEQAWLEEQESSRDLPAAYRRGYSLATMLRVIGRSLGRPLRMERVGRWRQRLEHLVLGRKLILDAMVASLQRCGV